ncbi:F-box/kelch-repeat protein At1g23390-like [Lotus japonicus]|uniref:F-box/kelch-repeat protein At1g23390-like n=1 Tax=Lotus japonicus TaxID=34305 RepID=UPI0025826994|nr:F-box/kelch-repeat protein At1g23390-like [Lotus japonicus]
MAAQWELAEEAPIHGDVLETILSHVPLIHLVPACHVSNTWKHAVFSSLAHTRTIKPWLIILTQSTRASHVITAHAYDPRSHVWVEMKLPHPLKGHPSATAAVRSSHSTLLYTLSPAEFAFSIDALHLDWHHAPAPRVWRTDPIVARVGQRVVVAGGACDFEDDPLAVEMYDMESNTWVMCQSMPAMLKGSSGSTWLSVAVAGEAVLVTEESSGMTFCFDTVSMKWDGPYDLCPDQSVGYCVTGMLGKRLMVAGVVGDGEDVKAVKLWAVKGGLGSGMMEEVGEMPEELLEKFKGDSDELGSLEVTWVGNFVYLRNTLEIEELVMCEVVNGSRCEWRSVRNAAVDGGTRMVVCGSEVRLEDLQSAMVSGIQTFRTKEL